MLITKGLLVKGIAASAALATATLGVVYKKEISNFISGEKTIEKLGIPSKCKEDVEECEISDSELKKIEFKDKGSEPLTIEGNVSGLKLSIKKLQESDKAKYGEDIKVGDLWFTFKTDNITEDIKVKKGNTEIASLIKGTNPEFKINSKNKLEKAWTVTTLAEKVNLKCPGDNAGSEKKCSVEASATINYKNNANDSRQTVTTTAQVTDGITYTKDQENYNQGFKFTVSTVVSGNDSASLPVGEYEIKYEEGDSKGWYLFKKAEITQNSVVTVTGGENGNTGGQLGNGQGANQDNTEINSKITGTLKLPESCKFSDSESTNPKECTLTQDQLKAIEFKDKGSETLTIEGSVSDLKLSIKKLQESDRGRYGDDINANDLWFTFKTDSTSADIKVKKGETEIASLIKGTNPEFKIKDNKLEKAWTVTELAKKVGLNCNTSQTTETCCPLGGNTTIDFLDGDTVKKMTVSDDSKTKTISVAKDQQDYNQGFKFNVTEEISGTDTATKLATGDYEIKYEEGKGWHLAKKPSASA